MNKTQNTFAAFLAQLEVKHTGTYTEQHFNEHPHKYNLFGLSKMLTDYGVDNAATLIEDKENDVTAIETPFIAHFSNDFVVVHEVTDEKVSFIWKGADHDLPVDKFIEAWDGVVLLARSSEKSIEPDYKEHRKTELIDLLKKIGFFSASGLLAVFVYISQAYYTNVGISLLLIINLAGLYISFLLLLKQMHLQSQYADKICSLFKQKDCNNILESKAAKLFGIFGWSEIGFGYFLTNVILLLLFPTLITAIAMINILTLPYSLWSVWYQKAKAKQWCALCLIVQFLLWSIFTTNLLFGYIQIPTFSSSVIARGPRVDGEAIQIITSAFSYGISVLGIHLLIPQFNTQKTIQYLRQSINSMKADEDIFVALLKKQPYHDTSDCDSIIRFGNPESSLRITVFSNPYCNPCSKMHQRIEKLLKQVENNISVQYILSSFGESLNSTNKYLFAACLADKTGSTLQILSDWFEKGKPMRDDYFKEMGLNIEHPEIEVEFAKHNAWKEKTKLRGTPTVLVNDYQLPESYKIEDLQYFTDLEL